MFKCSIIAFETTPSLRHSSFLNSSVCSVSPIVKVIKRIPPESRTCAVYPSFPSASRPSPISDANPREHPLMTLSDIITHVMLQATRLLRRVRQWDVDTIANGHREDLRDTFAAAALRHY